MSRPNTISIIKRSATFLSFLLPEIPLAALIMFEKKLNIKLIAFDCNIALIRRKHT